VSSKQRTNVASRLSPGSQGQASTYRTQVSAATYAGHLVPPLHWWRRLPAPAFTAAHVVVIRRAVAGIFIIGEPGWPAAAKGDPAAAIGVVLRQIKRHRRPSPGVDLVMSALLRCAIEGNNSAALVLSYVLDRIAGADPACTHLAASWQARPGTLANGA
jgi:hypothetical protein